ncbi:MAG: 50S ribosomal protein L13 [Lentisphaerae bacterium]|nr:50S ribosomal protein L13 [Lentisphaerota bacterium]
MKTTRAGDPGDNRKWVVFDAAGQPLGRLAVKVANALRGRNNPDYTPNVDTGDFVVVINAERVKLTGRKETQKIYQRYSGYRAGLKKTTAAVMRERHPDRMIREAVHGMLPGNATRRKLETRLKVYAGPEHPHAAQAPVAAGSAK